MMINRDTGMFLKSSFNSVEKDLAYITQKISENERNRKMKTKKINIINHLMNNMKKKYN